MTPERRYFFFSGLSGLLWGCLFLWAAAERTPSLAGLAVVLSSSSAIGCAVGVMTKRWTKLSAPKRICVAGASLYAAAGLLGFVMGLTGWLVSGSNERLDLVLLSSVLMAVVWLTLGWVVVFWPLAYFNHRVLGAVLYPNDADDQPPTLRPKSPL